MNRQPHFPLFSAISYFLVVVFVVFDFLACVVAFFGFCVVVLVLGSDAFFQKSSTICVMSVLMCSRREFSVVASSISRAKELKRFEVGIG